MTRLKITQKYDELADVLYISFGEPKEATVIEVGFGNLIRLDEKTGRIVGITLEDFQVGYDDEFIKELKKGINDKKSVRVLKGE